MFPHALTNARKGRTPLRSTGTTNESDAPESSRRRYGSLAPQAIVPEASSERVRSTLSGLSPFASPRPSNGEKFTNASERGSQFESPSLHQKVRASGRAAGRLADIVREVAASPDGISVESSCQHYAANAIVVTQSPSASTTIIQTWKKRSKPMPL